MFNIIWKILSYKIEPENGIINNIKWSCEVSSDRNRFSTIGLLIISIDERFAGSQQITEEVILELVKTSINYQLIEESLIFQLQLSLSQ